jgi:arylformamidase
LTQLYDISVPIFPGMPIYPGDPEVSFSPTIQIDQGACANVVTVSMGSQTGTHYDTPHHILNNGITTEQLDLNIFYGPAQVLHIDESIQAIEKADLIRRIHPETTRLLLKTKNSAYWKNSPKAFQPDYAALTKDGAQYLVSIGVQLIGIDYLSIELFESTGLEAHHQLLASGVVILEGINLSQVAPGQYTFCGFPLNYQGLDGAPTRAVLMSA